MTKKQAFQEYALLYANDFEDGGPDGSVYPRFGSGQGILKDDTEVIGAFDYPARMTTHADGTKGVRFPTKDENPGGYDYSMQAPLVKFRNRFLNERLLFKWKVYLPKQFDNNAPSYYWDNRYLFRYYDMRKEYFSMRFINNKEIGFYINGRRQRRTIKLKDILVGTEPYEATLEISPSGKGKIIGTFAGKGHKPFKYKQDLIPGAEIWINSPGNSLLSDTDLNYFSSIDSVEVYNISH